MLVALDDTLLRKTGRKIPGVTIGRDPLSPPFHVNLCYGLRFVQASVLVYPRQGGPARALPVRFEFAPPAAKPKSVSRTKAEPKAAAPTVGAAPDPAPCKASKAPLSAEEIAYSEEKKRKRLPQVRLNTIRSLRESLDQRAGLRGRQLIVSGDASYTTRVVLQGLPQRTTYIGRIRKDAKLYWPVAADSGKSQQPGRPRRYGALAPTPEQRLKDDTSWTSVRCFVAGQLRDIPVKTLGPFQRDEHEYLPLPKWRRLATGARPSLLDLLNLLRNQIFARNLHSPLVDIEGFLKNAPESVKPGKLPLTPEIQCTLAA